MFKKLRNKIILITMAITTAVLLSAGASIMVFSSTLRPEPTPFVSFTVLDTPPDFPEQEIQAFVQNDRQEGNTRLLITLLYVGAIIEILVFILSYTLSEKIVAPVKDSYEKQKLFIANASHELKTPLAVIEANMEALEVAKGSEEWKNNIESEITHANKLVLDLLQLAKMDAGNLVTNPPEPVDLAALVHEHVELFRPKFSGKIIMKSTAKTLPATLARQDFLQVLDILLDNATKYGKQKISLALSAHELTIKNDGARVAKDDLAKIFDRFYQTDKTKPGSGLGLAIAKALCTQNGWQISCASDAKSTSFTLKLTSAR